MLRAISRVAAPCSSTAAAIAVVTSLISPIVLEMFRIAETAVVVTSCMHGIIESLSPEHGQIDWKWVGSVFVVYVVLTIGGVGVLLAH